MRVDIIQNKGSKMLRRICHEGEVYVMAPKKGSYKIRLYNHSNKRRLAVVTVDGVNVINGEDGDFEGSGYVMQPWEKVEIPGWRRDGEKVAAFLFRPEEQSYAAQTGRGTRNVGVIGVAVFDEKPVVRPNPPIVIREEHHHHHHDWWPRTRWLHTCDTVSGDTVRYSSTAPPDNGTLMYENEVNCSTAGSAEPTLSMDTSASRSAERVSKGRAKRTVIRRRRRSVSSEDSPVDVGTGYGHEVRFHTTDTTFERATESPAEVVTLRYATRSRLESWGVPVDEMERPSRRPEAFPKSQEGCPPPPGWRG